MASGGASNATSASHRESGRGGWPRGPCRAQAQAPRATPPGPSVPPLQACRVPPSAIRSLHICRRTVPVFGGCRSPLATTTSGRRWFTPMSSTADRPAFAVRSTDFEAIAEVFMPIRIRRHNRSWHGTQVIEAKGFIATQAGGSTAFYTGRKPQFRILCGSI